MRFVIKIVFS